MMEKLFKYYQSYYLNFGLSILCGILGILYAVFFVNESIQKEEICESTPKLRYNESRYSEIRDIVNKCQLPQFFIPYTVTI